MLKRWFGSLRVRLAYSLAYGQRQVRDYGFFTAGFWPPLPRMMEVPALAQARCQANLYELALREHPGPRPLPRAVLDIGCGVGGGLLYARAVFPKAILVGVDLSGAAVRQARRRLGGLAKVSLHRVSGDRTRLAPHRFDLIVSIGAVNAIGPTEMLRECARLLAPGGVVRITAVLSLTPDQAFELFNAAAAATGLALRRISEITEGTRAALDHDRDWAESVICAMPAPFRRQAREMAALPGTRAAQAMADGRLRSYAILVDHPAIAWAAPRLLAA